MAAQAYAGIGDKGIGLGNPDNAGDVLSVLGHAVFGSSVIGAGLTKLLILMVLSSAAASTLTTILPTARTTLSMAVFQAIPANFKRIHPRHLTPDLVDGRHGPGLDRVLRGPGPAQPERARRHRRVDRPADRVLLRDDRLRLRVVLPPRAVPQLEGAARQGHPAAAWAASSSLSAFVRAVLDYAKPDYGTTSWTLPFPPHWQLGGVFLTGIGSLVLGLVLMVVYNARGAGLLRRPGASARDAHPGGNPRDLSQPLASRRHAWPVVWSRTGCRIKTPLCP